MKTTKEMIDVMRAFDEGKRIEFKPYGGDWLDTPAPSWDWNTKIYRIKEEPVKMVTWWMPWFKADSGFLFNNGNWYPIKEYRGNISNVHHWESKEMPE